VRILQIRFKNLNSLVGEWSVDLTHPAYASDGIFAITGPTGAGKSTILDAICLALYGRTPRLNKVTKSSNEIMSRLTGECFAEVTFETQAGKFRCHWSQHRARKSPDGELQQPRHEIADALSGQIFKTKLRGVADQIASVTGMDFHQFTRSMLLAQGDFATFLLAAPDERSPILEQITGTEIYSQISMGVHERRSAERGTLDRLQAELTGMQLLSEDDCQQLRDSLKSKTLQEKDLAGQVQQKNQAVSWLDGIDQLEKELQAVHEQKLALIARQEAFAPERLRLGLARRALELSGDYAGLVALRDAQNMDETTLAECRHQLPAWENEVARAEQACTLAAESLDKDKDYQRQMAIVIRQARELDLRVAEKTAPIAAATAALASLEAERTALLARHADDQQALTKASADLEEARQFLDEHPADAGLTQQMAGISARFNSLRDLWQQQSAKAETIVTAQQKREGALQGWKKRLATAEALGKELESAEAAATAAQSALSGVLEGRELNAWRNELSGCQERSLRLERLTEAHGQMTELRRQQDELHERQKRLVADAERLASEILNQSTNVSTLEKAAELHETQVALLNRIKDLESARHQLRDGEPCPLCGSVEHPYAEGNLPAPDEASAALEKLRAGLKQANAELSSLRVQETGVQKDWEQANEAQREKATLLKTANTRFVEGLLQLDIELPEGTPREALTRLLQECQAAQGKALSVVQAAEAEEKHIAAAREKLESLRKSLVEVDKELQTAAHNHEAAEKEFVRLMQEARTLAEQSDQLLRDVISELNVFGVDTLSAETIDSVASHLIERRDQWLVQETSRAGLEKQIAALEAGLRPQTANLEKLAAEVKARRTALQLLLQERDNLTQQRRDLFGDKEPAEEEEHLVTAVAAAEKHLNDKREALAAANMKLGNHKSRIDGLVNALKVRADQLDNVTELFAARLAGSGFADEENYLQACLPEDERHRLFTEDERLSAENIELVARQRDRAERLVEERGKQVTELSRELLLSSIETFTASLKELQQDMGGIRQRLQDNEELRDKQQDRVAAIETQKRECSRWDTLHELIGSADGKKYRNFAQGLTFEMMVRHANRQLQKMTDRYVLIRDSIQPLELNVIDNYQAGEIRSTKNLSGGESFLVSLALALGLSHMASRNVRVDSLFLDEGFGALDEDALDTALETLAGLQQDGKLIGVISHVVALKERIGTQIQVDPQTGGRSMLAGPGCKRVGSDVAAAILDEDIKI